MMALHSDFLEISAILQSALTPWTVRLLTLYFLLVLIFIALSCFWRSPKDPMARAYGTMFIVLNIFAFALLSVVYAQPSVTTSTVAPGAVVTGNFKPQFTVPSNADQGANLLPNIFDPAAVNPQTVCPGYKASNVQNTPFGITADLTIAGPGCHVYGNDIVDLRLTVEFQSESRLHIEITPTYIGAQNSSWFLLPEALVPKPVVEPTEGSASFESDLGFSWDNDPTFSFTVTRLSTGDVLFSTEGSVLVYEDQFIEFGSPLPENYNLYGMGEAIHAFRLGNNFTRTFYAADAGDPIDGNIYSNHPFYLDTRYFEVDAATGNLTYVANATDPSKTYKSYSHGSFLRNAHPMEALMRPTNITWRALGGNIDLYFYAGPTQVEVTKQYQLSTIGLPAMQSYWTLGYHQCRWGYKDWAELRQVVDDFKKFEIPLDTIWYVLGSRVASGSRKDKLTITGLTLIT
jgi:alpha-glucosidase